MLAPWTLFESRAERLSALLQDYWGITANLCDVPGSPRWLINSTCYETGKDWRFEASRVGDYAFGYTHDTKIPLSDALAASAGFPGLIGALAFDTKRSSWFNYTDGSSDSDIADGMLHVVPLATKAIQLPYRTVHLWDGGVYDNFGLEGEFDIERGPRDDIDLLIASDATGRTKSESYQPGAKALLRMVSGIMMVQMKSLRVRSFVERIENHGFPGVFLGMGNTCAGVIGKSQQKDDASRVCMECLSESDAKRASDFPTTLRMLTPDEFELLFRHGYEVADYSLYAHHADQFAFVGYMNSR